jgi:nitrogen fixation NifU-like protein
MADPYRERVIDHYRNPRNEGVLEDADCSGQEDNPVCGDTVRVDVRLEDGRVTAARFRGRGCVLCLAAASLLTEEIQGKTVDELRALRDEDAFEMLGFRPGPVRARCALLALRALQAGLGQLDSSPS